MQVHAQDFAANSQAALDARRAEDDLRVAVEVGAPEERIDELTAVLEAATERVLALRRRAR